MIKDRRTIQTQDGIIYHVVRKKKNFLIDTIEISYMLPQGLKTIRKNIFAPLSLITARLTEAFVL